MQGSYILLAAVGIFLLIGGGRRLLKSFNLSSVGAVAIIILVIIGNIFTPIGDGVTIYFGSLIIGLISIVFMLSRGLMYTLKIIFASVVIVTILAIYDYYVVQHFAINASSSMLMFTLGTAIISFIFARNSAQAFIISALSIMILDIVLSVMSNKAIVIGNVMSFDILIYSAFTAVLLNELVNDMIAHYNDRVPDLSFESGLIDEEEDNDNNLTLQ